MRSLSGPPGSGVFHIKRCLNRRKHVTSDSFRIFEPTRPAVRRNHSRHHPSVALVPPGVSNQCSLSGPACVNVTHGLNYGHYLIPRASPHPSSCAIDALVSAVPPNSRLLTRRRLWVFRPDHSNVTGPRRVSALIALTTERTLSVPASTHSQPGAI